MISGIDRPLTMLLGALGGEGGGLMADWVVAACEHAGLLVQSTSIPGVAQRTGATTYYLEMMKPKGHKRTEPVFGLYPAPGNMDVVMTTELVEAGRAAQSGFISPERTILISSSHRVLAIGERMAMGDGEFDSKHIFKTLNALAKQPMLADFAELAAAERVALNAILLGLLAASKATPIPEASFLHAISARGVAVDNNLEGFRIGVKAGKAALVDGPVEADIAPLASVGRLADEIDAYPDELKELIGHGVERLQDYQDDGYARLYLERIGRIYNLETKARGKSHKFALTLTTARFLALWMAYEDVIRVVQLKSKPGRFAKIRREIQAAPDEPVKLREFLKPGIEEATTLLPKRLGGALLRWADRKGWTHRLHVPLRLRTDTVLGYVMLRFLARLKFMRKRGLRYAHEQQAIEHWLEAVEAGAQKNYQLGVSIAGLGRLIKGYSDTRSRGFRNLDLISNKLVTPALTGTLSAAKAVGAIGQAGEAALADEEGVALNNFLQERV